jgi:WD40 repeat protein
MLLRYFFGEDIFISYTRADAITYAAGLAGELTRRDFSCFLDQWGTPPGLELPKPLKRALHRSAALVLVGSEGVIHSKAVEKEIRTFRRTKRMIIPIDFNGALQCAPWYELIAGLALTVESTEALATGSPSVAVVGRIEKSFVYTRRNQRARRTFTAAAILLACLAIASAVSSLKAVRSAALAREQELIARKNLDAFHAEEVIAKKNTAEAETQASVARVKAAEAERQQQIAEERRKVAASREIASSALGQLDVDPELSLLLAAEAAAVNANPESESALRRSLLESRVRVIVDGASDGDLSPDSRLLVTAHRRYDAAADVFKSWLRLTDTTSGRTVRELRWDSRSFNQPAYSPDGRLIAAICNVQQVCVFEAETGRPVAEMSGHTAEIHRVHFSHNSRWIATSAADRSSRVWEASTGRLIAQWPGVRSDARDAQFSPDDRYVLTTFLDQEAAVWESATGRVVKTFPAGKTAWDIPSTWSPDGQYVLTVAHGSPTRLWRTSDWQSAHDLSAGYAVHTEFSQDGKRLLTVNGGNVQVWDTATGQSIIRFGEGNVIRASFAPDPDLIVTADFGGSAKVWTYLGERLAVLRGHRGDLASAVFSRDGRWVVTGAKDEVRLWAAGAGLPHYAGPEGKEWIWNAVFSPDGKILVSTGQGETVRVAETASGRELYVLKTNCDIAHAPVFSRDSRFFLTSDRAYAVHVWETKTGRRIATLNFHKNGLHTAAISPDGRLAVTADINGDAIVWETSTARILFQPSQPTATESKSKTTKYGGKKIVIEPDEKIPVKAASFSPDGRLLVTAHDDWDASIRGWDARTGRNLYILAQHGEEAERVAFSPDSSLAAAARRESAPVWDARTGRPVTELSVPTGKMRDVQFSADGASLVTSAEVLATKGWQRWTWDTATWKGYASAIFQGDAMDISPDGRFGLFGGDPVVDIEELSSGMKLVSLRGNRESVNGARFAPDGKLVATAGRDGVVRLYACELCAPVTELLQLARQRLQVTGRQLIAEERLKFLRGLASPAAAMAGSRQ